MKNKFLLPPNQLNTLKQEIEQLSKKIKKFKNIKEKIDHINDDLNNQYRIATEKLFLHQQEEKYQNLNPSVFELLEVYDKYGKENVYLLKKLNAILKNFNLHITGYFPETNQRVLRIQLKYLDFDDIVKAYDGIKFFLPYIKPLNSTLSKNNQKKDHPIIKLKIFDNDLSEHGSNYLCYTPHNNCWGVYGSYSYRFNEKSDTYPLSEKQGDLGLFNMLKLISKHYYYEDIGEKKQEEREKLFNKIEESFKDEKDIDQILKTKQATKNNFKL